MSTPLLQLALDFVCLEPAIAVAAKTGKQVDIIEIGTPLCKAVGLIAISAIRAVCPDRQILADFKTPDAGGIEAQMAFAAGADMMTVMAGATPYTVKAALDVARQHDKHVLVELTGVRDIVARAEELKEWGADWAVYHRGWDEQEAAQNWTHNDLSTIRQLLGLGFRVTLAGGITLDSLGFFRTLPVSVVVVGKAIHQAEDPLASVSELRAEMARLWPAEPTS